MTSNCPPGAGFGFVMSFDVSFTKAGAQYVSTPKYHVPLPVLGMTATAFGPTPRSALSTPTAAYDQRPFALSYVSTGETPGNRSRTRFHELWVQAPNRYEYAQSR